MRRSVPILFVVLALGFAPAPFPRAERKGKAVNEMIGMWSGGSQLEITHDRMNYNPGSGSYSYALRIDPGTRPARYDIKGVAEGRKVGREFNGIYRVEGDTLTLCYNSGSQNRPTSFDGPGKGSFTEVYKRVRR